MGGGAILRAASPILTTSLPAPSSSSYALSPLPFSAASTTACRPSPRPFSNEGDLEGIQGLGGSVGEEYDEEGDGDSGSSWSRVLGIVPSMEEAEMAICSLQQVILPGLCNQIAENTFNSTSKKKNATDQILTDSSNGSFAAKSDQFSSTQPGLDLSNPRAGQHGFLYHAFHLLQTNPSTQRMVVSLASDEAVWKAVVNSRAIKELKQSFQSDDNQQSNFSEDASQFPNQFLSWILDKMKLKIEEIVRKIMRLMNDLFRPSEKEKITDILKDTVRSSLVLSVMALMVVVITRMKTQ